MFTFQQWLADFIVKAAGHKYIKRIPYQSGGKLRYRYIYNVTHTHQGRHVLDPDHMKVGTKLMLDTTSGKEVHGHIVSVNGDQVIFEYDDGPHKGKLSRPMSKQALAEELDRVHGISEKLSTARAKQKAVLDKLKERGASEKQIAREQRRLDALGGGREGTPAAQESAMPPSKEEGANRDRALDKYAQEVASALDIESVFRVSPKGKILGLKKGKDGSSLEYSLPFEGIPREQVLNLAQSLVNERPRVEDVTPIVREWLAGMVEEASKYQIERNRRIVSRTPAFRELASLLNTTAPPSLDGRPRDPRLVTLSEIKMLANPVLRRRAIIEDEVSRSGPKQIEIYEDVPRDIMTLIDRNRVKSRYNGRYGIADLASALGAEHPRMAQVKQNEQQIKETITAHISPMLDTVLDAVTRVDEAQEAVDSTIKTLEQVQARAEKMASAPFTASPTQRAIIEMSSDPATTESAYKDAWRQTRVDYNNTRAQKAGETLVDYKREANKIIEATPTDVDWGGVVRRFRSFNEGEGGRPHVKQINKWASEIRDALIEQKLKERGLK